MDVILSIDIATYETHEYRLIIKSVIEEGLIGRERYGFYSPIMPRFVTKWYGVLPYGVPTLEIQRLKASLPGQSIAGPHSKAELEHMTEISGITSGVLIAMLRVEDKEPIIITSKGKSSP